MGTDIYNRDAEVRKYSPTLLEVSDDLSFLLLQIEMLLFTKPGEVMGSPKMGIDLESLLFSLNVTQAQLTQKINNQILTYCPLAYKYSVQSSVNFIKEVNRDIAIVDIIINDERLLSVLV
jgi:hypothetical protein